MRLQWYLNALGCSGSLSAHCSVCTVLKNDYLKGRVCGQYVVYDAIYAHVVRWRLNVID